MESTRMRANPRKTPLVPFESEAYVSGAFDDGAQDHRALGHWAFDLGTFDLVEFGQESVGKWIGTHGENPVLDPVACLGKSRWGCPFRECPSKTPAWEW
jgi:hypothetical protein